MFDTCISYFVCCWLNSHRYQQPECSSPGFELLQFLLVWASPFVKLLVFVHSPSVLDYFLAWKAVFILSWDMLLSNFFTIDPSSPTRSPGLYHICFCPQHNYFYLRSWIYPEICSFPNFLMYLWSVEWPMASGNQIFCCYHFVGITLLSFLICWN